MDVDQFAERMAEVRLRFATKLRGRLSEIDAIADRLIEDTPDVGTLVFDAHRRVHDMCGIGPTLGFFATGQAARVSERILLQASREKRRLTAAEFDQFKHSLIALRVAADADLTSTSIVPE
jgi:hypothetical protein